MAEKVKAFRPAGLVLALLAAVALGVGAAWWWRQRSPAGPVDSGLPRAPDLAGRSAELRQSLADAQARVGTTDATPDSVAALGRLYHANSFNAEAAACWKILRRAEPRTAKWCYYLADLSRAAGDEEELRANLDLTVQLAPDYAPAWLLRADLEFKTAHLDAAESAYRRRLELVPDDAYALLGLARIALQRGQRDEGTRQIVALIRQVPDFPSSHNIYAEILAQAGDARGAAEQRRLGATAGRFRAADDPWLRELQPACFDLERLSEWGEVDLQTRRGDLGRALFERVVRLAPENPRGYERLGAYYLAASEPARASEVLERGSRLPDAPERLFSALCDAYHAQHDPAGELHAAEAGLVLRPNSSVLHNGRAHALAGLQRFDEAIAEYRLAIACAPFAADPVANLGELLLQQGRAEEAKAAFQQALQLQPMYPKALLLLAGQELDAGELESAAPRIGAFFAENPTAPGARALVVELHLKQARLAGRRGDPAGIEHACRDGLALVSDSADLAGLLGAVLVQQDRWPEAQPVLESAHVLRPDDPRITILLGERYARLGRTDMARKYLVEGSQQARQIGEAGLAARADELLQNLTGR